MNTYFTLPDMLWLGFGAMGLSVSLLMLRRQARWMRRLPGIPPGSPKSQQFVSVVMAGRDEEARISRTLQHLFAQEGVNLEIIVVDDRSSDGTPRILEELAAREPRLRVLRVEELPERWLGKCHACWLGAEQARGEWILFTDADCWLSKDVIARALGAAEREQADHLTLTPGIEPATLSAAGWHLSFLLTMADLFARVNADSPKGHVGLGGFNLVRKDVYRRCGGYEALRLTVLDDVRLGLLIRKLGKRTRAYIGGDDALCFWGRTAGAMIKIMEKNFFAAVDFRTALGLGGGMIGIGFTLIAFAGLFVGGGPGFFAFLCSLSFALAALPLARKLGWPAKSVLAVPVVFPLVFYAMLRSTILTLRQGGVRWRDTFYPLSVLREGMVRGE